MSPLANTIGRTLPQVVEAIYDSIADIDRWQATLDAICRLAIGQLAMLGVVDTVSNAARFSVVIEHCVPGDRKHPWKDRFDWPVGVTRLVDAHPCVLEQIVGKPPREGLRAEIAKQPRTDGLDQRPGRLFVCLLISAHEGFQTRR